MRDRKRRGTPSSATNNRRSLTASSRRRRLRTSRHATPESRTNPPRAAIRKLAFRPYRRMPCLRPSCRTWKTTRIFVRPLWPNWCLNRWFGSLERAEWQFVALDSTALRSTHCGRGAFTPRGRGLAIQAEVGAPAYERCRTEPEPCEPSTRTDQDPERWGTPLPVDHGEGTRDRS